MKKSVICWCLVNTAVWVFLGCHGRIIDQRIDLGEIPDGTYKVTVHQSYSKYYAVLFDNLYDDREVIMLHTEFTKQVGRDRPDAYLDRFRERIRSHRVFRISDKDGVVRGYLVISNLLDYVAYRPPGRDRIMIKIVDPSLRALDPS